MAVEIRTVRGHYEIYVNGVFYTSCDTRGEAEKEKEDLEK